MTDIQRRLPVTEFEGDVEAKVDEILSSLTLAKLKVILKFMARFLLHVNRRLTRLENKGGM